DSGLYQDVERGAAKSTSFPGRRAGSAAAPPRARRGSSPRAGGLPAPAADDGVEAPLAAALRGHVEEDEAEEDGGHALVLQRPGAVRRVELPVGDRHLAGEDEGDRPGEETEHDADAADELERPADADLGHQGNLGAAGHAAEPAEEDDAAGLQEEPAGDDAEQEVSDLCGALQVHRAPPDRGADGSARRRSMDTCVESSRVEVMDRSFFAAIREP